MFKYILPIILLTVLTGCGVTKNDTENQLNKELLLNAFSNKRVLPYDEVVDRGQYAEVWIAPYKDKMGNRFSERRMNFWVVKPDFIVGEELPKSKKLIIEKPQSFTTFNINPKPNRSIDIDKEVLKYIETAKDN
jgi:hypothetical protein